MKLAITFGSKYNHEPHPASEDITGNSFLVVEGENWEEARAQAFALLGNIFAFDYPYEDDEGNLDPDFQRQIRMYGLTEVELEEAL